MFDFADTLQALLGSVDDDYPLISVYGKYDVIKPLLEDLIMSGVEIANEIELQEYAVAHYNKEFVLYLSEYGVNVEKTYRDGSYLYGAGNISFVHEDCNSKLLPYIQSKTIYEFGITDNNEECDCDECYECTCKENNTPSTTASVVYRVNGKEVDETTWRNSHNQIMKEIEEFERQFWRW